MSSKRPKPPASNELQGAGYFSLPERVREALEKPLSPRGPTMPACEARVSAPGRDVCSNCLGALSRSRTARGIELECSPCSKRGLLTTSARGIETVIWKPIERVSDDADE